MKILVVGLNHQIQPATIKSFGGGADEFERSQKEQFGRTLMRIVEQEKAEFIGEEARHGEETFTERIAGLKQRKYANIEMPPAERKRRSIPSDYSGESSHYPSEQKAAWDREREDYMVREALAQAGSAASAVILCGRNHTDALAVLFRQAGHEVKTYDLNLEDWYVEDWLAHLLGRD